MTPSQARPSGAGDGAPGPDAPSADTPDSTVEPGSGTPLRGRRTPSGPGTRSRPAAASEVGAAAPEHLRIMVVDPSGERAGCTHDLSNALVERGSDVDLYTSPAWRSSAARCHTREYTPRIVFTDRGDPQGGDDVAAPVKGFRKVVGAVRRLWTLAKLVPRTRRYDVVHCQGMTTSPLDLLWIWLVSRWATVACAVDEHPPSPRRRRFRPSRVVRSRAYRAADVLFVSTAHAAARLRERFDLPAGKVVEVPQGRMTHLLDQDERPPSCPIAHGGSPVILLLAQRLAPHTGVDVLLRAANHLRRSVWDFRVVVAGRPDGDLTPWYDLVRDLGLERSVEFRPGRVEDGELPAYIRQATVLAFPQQHLERHDVAVAACTFGKAIVGTRVGGLDELVETADNGIVVSPDDPRALAEALARVLRDGDLRRRYETNSLIYARTDLAWRRLAGETIAFYRKAVAGEAA